MSPAVIIARFIRELLLDPSARVLTWYEGRNPAAYGMAGYGDTRTEGVADLSTIGRLARGAPSRGTLLLIAAAAAALAAAALLLGVLTRPGQAADAAVASIILDWFPGGIRRALDSMARPLLPYVFAPLAALLFLRGLVRREWRTCLAAAATLPAIPLSTWLRDQAVTRPRLGVSGYAWNTFPSTHATVGFVVLATVILLWPGRSPWSRRLRLGLAVTVGLVIFIGNVSWYAHRPVDVLGSFGIVAAPLLLMLGVLPRRRNRAARAGRST